MDGRSRKLALAAVPVVLATVATAGYLVVRHDRPAVRGSERHGVDVSHHQGVIEWDAVAADGIAFAYLKATEGGDWTDPRFADNLVGATGAGLEVGAYHFFTNCADGATQARHFLDTVPRETTSLPPALDLEDLGQCAGAPTRDELLAEVGAFIDTVEAATGRPVVVYVLDGIEDPYRVLDALAAQPHWDRSLFRRPADDRWVLWQANHAAAVDGIAGGVDLNVADPGVLAALPLPAD